MFVNSIMVEKWAGSGVGGILKKEFSCPLLSFNHS